MTTRTGKPGAGPKGHGHSARSDETRRKLVRLAAWGVPVLVVLAAAVTAVAVTAGSDDDGDGGERAASGRTWEDVQREEKASDAYEKQAREAFRPIGDGLSELLKAHDAWRKDPAKAGDLRATLDRVEPRFAEAADDVAALDPYRYDPRADDVYAASSRLFVEFAGLERLLVGQPAEALADQLELSGRRLRTVGDRLFDAAQVMIGVDRLASTDSISIEGVPEVPDWLEEGMAAGPPLDDPPPPAADPPPRREGERPQQPEGEWQDDIAELDIASDTQVTEAIGTGDADALRALARRLQDDAKALGDITDPTDGRERAVALRLGLLVDAEAARLAQAATLAGDPATAAELSAMAKRLVPLGEGLRAGALATDGADGKALP
ncbi:MAG: hypothetical protein ACRDY7_05100 [Acidimicrobiia bacterium]